YGVSPLTLVATSGGSSSPVVFSIVSGPGTISGNILTITGAGTVVVAANQTGNANYAAAAQVTQSVTVTQATPVLSWAATASITYGAKLNSVARPTSGGVAGKFSYTANGNAVTGSEVLPVGTYVQVATFTPTDSVDYTSATITDTLTVTQASQTISFTAP